MANARNAAIASFALGFALWTIIVVPGFAAAVVLLWCTSSFWVLWRARRAAAGTALIGAVWWMFAAVACGAFGQFVGLFERLALGRPWTGHATYLACLCGLAALWSALLARRSRAWVSAALIGVVVLVLVIPWTGTGGYRPVVDADRVLHLGMPWSWLFLLLALVGVGNFLPTRYLTAASVFGIGVALEYVGLTWRSLETSWRLRLWSLVPLFLSASIWAAYGSLGLMLPARSDLERLWFWFRDHWGLVPGLWVMERFNRGAAAERRGTRLRWRGVSANGTPAQVGAILETTRLAGLIGAYAEPARIGREAVRRSS